MDSVINDDKVTVLNHIIITLCPYHIYKIWTTNGQHRWLLCIWEHYGYTSDLFLCEVAYEIMQKIMLLTGRSTHLYAIKCWLFAGMFTKFVKNVRYSLRVAISCSQVLTIRFAHVFHSNLPPKCLVYQKIFSLATFSRNWKLFWKYNWIYLFNKLDTLEESRGGHCADVQLCYVRTWILELTCKVTNETHSN